MSEKTELSKGEQKKRDSLSGKIRKAQASYRDIAESLREIDAKELYFPHRNVHQFAYVEFDMSNSQVSQYLKAAEVLSNLAAKECLLPATESQCRELGRIKTPEDRVKVWTAVTSEGTPTAKAIEKKSQELLGDNAPPKSSSKRKKAQSDGTESSRDNSEPDGTEGGGENSDSNEDDEQQGDSSFGVGILYPHEDEPEWSVVEVVASSPVSTATIAESGHQIMKCPAVPVDDGFLFKFESDDRKALWESVGRFFCSQPVTSISIRLK